MYTVDGLAEGIRSGAEFRVRRPSPKIAASASPPQHCSLKLRVHKLHYLLTLETISPLLLKNLWEFRLWA